MDISRYIPSDKMKQLEYHNTLAASMLITLFSEMLKLSQKKSKEQNLVKDNIESSGILCLSKWKLQNLIKYVIDRHVLKLLW